jgi:hypothetical protein
MGWSLRTSSMNLVCTLDTAQLGKIFVHYINTTQVILKLLLCKKPDNIESSTFCVYNIHTPIWRRKCRKIHVVCTYFYCKEKPSNSSLLNKKGILNAIQRSHTGGFHLHLLVFPFIYQFNSRTGVLVHWSLPND